MDLLVIVLCLLSERFLVHKIAHHRFHWFMSYTNRITSMLPVSFSAWVTLALILLPLIFLVMAVLQVLDHLLFGVVALLINIAVFYYCLGPVNPFYPVHATQDSSSVDHDMGHYLVQANNELFAVLFWYLVLGPVGILAYRLISLAQTLPSVGPQATHLLSWLDWIPVRMTALLYLLVGNFQAGYQIFIKLFFTAPEKNNHMLYVCGLASMDHREQPIIVEQAILQAENLVEHATIVFLALLAFCTIVAWI